MHPRHRRIFKGAEEHRKKVYPDIILHSETSVTSVVLGQSQGDALLVNLLYCTLGGTYTWMSN